MLERMKLAGARRAEAARIRAIERLAEAVTPPKGVTVEASDTGLILSGKQLRWRMINNPILRSFWK
jgi:hypothetical protein